MSFSRWESPVVNNTLKKRRIWQTSQKALYWSAANACMALVMYSEMCCNSVGVYFRITSPLLWYAECGLAVLFSVNFIFDIFRYLWPRLSSTPVELLPAQKRLLGVKDSDAGFRVITPQPLTPQALDGTPIINMSTFTLQGCYSKKHSPGSPYSPSSLPGSPYSPTSLPHSYYGSSPSSSYSSSPSFDRIQNLSPSSLHASFSPGHSPNWQDESYVRSRKTSPIKISPCSSDDRITDEYSLNKYLKEQEEKEYQSKLDISGGSPQSFWNYGRSPLDYSHILRKYEYQIACRSPQSLTAHNQDDLDLGSQYSSEEIWSHFSITEDQLYSWIERIRKWLCLTVVARLAKEIDDTNIKLRRIGCEDMEIGEVGVSTMKQLALTKGQFVPFLNALVTYLDFSSNQEYLVRRIQELGKDGCMSEFTWSQGGHYGKKWGEHLPTDSAIVMHLFCTYMDSRLPAHPKYPDGKTFTSQYFLKAPEKPNLSRKDNFCIYQSSINPPHFQVLFGEQVWNLPKGRNNMFQAMLLFLYHVHIKERGMLGRVNLGLSGVNIRWIFD